VDEAAGAGAGVGALVLSAAGVLTSALEGFSAALSLVASEDLDLPLAA
jgi:hypothetical protein